VAGLAGVGVRLPLSAGDLGGVVGWLRGQVAGGVRGELAGGAVAVGGPGLPGLCVAVVGGFLRLVCPRLGSAVGDEVVGLGGVAGVRDRLVPGSGWARVGSWGALERAVADAGAGASAVVLVSFAGGGQVGHALVLYATAGGVRWVDPADGDVAGRAADGRW
jgi:hypothetical protein